MSARVRDTDRGLATRAARMAACRALRVRVGILSDAPVAGEAGVTLLEVAAANEFGTDAVPQRSFVRGTVDADAPQIRAVLAAQARRVADGAATPEAAFQQIGAAVVGLIQARIAAGIAPANAPSTIARKHSATPLVDTGQLRSAVTFAVERR